MVSMSTTFQNVVDGPREGKSSSTASNEGALAGSRQQWLMIALVVAFPIVACLSAFLVTGSQYFRRYADPQWIRSSDRIYTAHDVPCEVIVYGDSTAITGVDPATVQRLTGLRTCNVAQTKGAIVVLGTSGLDIFLSHNPRPRYLVLQFSGADFYKSKSWDDSIAFIEGVIPMLRYYPRREFVTAVLRRPELILGVMHYAYVTGPVNWWLNRRHYSNWNPDTPLVDVHFVRPEAPIVDCAEAVDIDPIFHTPETAFIQHLRAKYAAAADHVLIDVAPLSSCDPRFGYIAGHLHGISNTLERYPSYDYNQGYTHYTAAGAQRLSATLAAQIKAVEGGKTGEGEGSPAESGLR